MNKYTLLSLILLSTLFSCHSKRTVYRAPDYRDSNYLIDNATGRRVSDSAGRIVVDTVNVNKH